MNMNEFSESEAELLSSSASSSALVLPPDAGLALVAESLVSPARADGVALTGDGGLLTGLVQQGALDAEITDHLGYEPHAVEGRGSGNSRNGSFDPVTVPVGQRRLMGLDQMVISLYAKGLTTGDITSHLFDVHDQHVDRSTISRITDGIVEDMSLWQSRPLDSAEVLARRVDRAQEPRRHRRVDVVLRWIEGTARLGPCRVASRRRPTLCRLLVRNSLRFASKKHWGPITRQLKAIYTAPSLNAAEQAFEEFADNWDDLYPAMIKSWRGTWEDFIPFLEFPAELRKIVYSTNAIESLNARFRKAAVRRGHFPTEQAAFKVLYLTSIERRKNRTNPTGRINAWKSILNTLAIHADRLAAANH